MLDRQKVEAILGRRFPGATLQEVAAAANAIMGLDDAWEEDAMRRETWNNGPSESFGRPARGHVAPERRRRVVGFSSLTAD